MFRRLQEFGIRTAATLLPWLVLGGLVTLLDFRRAPSAEVVILHLAVVLAAFQLTARRNLPRVILVTFSFVWLPWLLTQQRDAAWDRVWIGLCLLLAGLYHVGNQRRRHRRLFIRKQLQQNVRGRTQQLRQAVDALREEIAARHATQQRLDRAQTHLQSLAQRMRLQVLRKDTHGVITYANDAFCQAVNRLPQQVIGSTDADLYPESLAAKYQIDDEFVLRTGSTIDHIESHPSGDGQTGWVQVFKAPELDANEQIIGIQIVFWDVTDRHRQTAELRRSEARKRALFNASREAVLLVDDEGVVVEANSSAVSLLGQVGLPLSGVRLADVAVLSPAPAGQTDDPPSKAVDSGGQANDSGGQADQAGSTLAIVTAQTAADDQPPRLRWADLPYGIRRQISLKPAGKAAFPAEVSVHPIPLDTSTGLAIFVRDVTLQQQALAALREGKLAAEKASRIKSEFMASVSHEVRTPLGGILGSADLLAEMDLPPRAQQYVQMIQHSGLMLSNVIADILDLASIEAGRLQINPEPIDFHRCIGEAFRSLATRAIGKDLELVLDIQAAVPRYLQADPKRLRQIVINLVGNAIKFTPQGFVMLKASLSDDNWLLIEVHDSGIGIPPEHLSKIFEPFEQGDSGTTRRFGGTGLGLSISQQLVERMGGEIEVNSSVDQGSTFRCRLPMLRCPPADDRRTPLSLPDAVALDIAHPEQRRAIQDLLTSRGIACRDSADVLIRDVRRSPAIGRDSEQMITNKEQAAARVLWLARVDDPSPEADSAGVSNSQPAILLKPILPDDLLRWLEDGKEPVGQIAFLTDQVHGQRALTTVPVDQNVAGQPLPAGAPRLLLADDSPVNQAVIRDFLVAANYAVDVVADGQAAIDAFAREQYQCVLMDLQMPGMDGIEAMQRICQRDQAAGRDSPPFIALTAHATDEHRQRCLAAGMKAFLVKPINRRELVATVGQWVQPEKSPDPFVPDETPPAPSDWQDRLLRAAGNDPATAASLTEAFLDEVPQLLRQLSAALSSGDAKAARRAAHTLKSCLKYVADEVDWGPAQRCEKLAADDDLTAAAAMLPELTEIADRWVSRFIERETARHPRA